ncbi:hypothetical protein [Merdimonas faecis]|jgi:hypothetical protein
MKIVPYDKKYKEDFIEMNKQWISAMFVIEEEDLAVLNNIEGTIEAGGQIFFAIDGEENVLACCMIAPLPNGEWEIEKFCAKGMYTGTGAGNPSAPKIRICRCRLIKENFLLKEQI